MIYLSLQMGLPLGKIIIKMDKLIYEEIVKISNHIDNLEIVRAFINSKFSLYQLLDFPMDNSFKKLPEDDQIDIKEKILFIKSEMLDFIDNKIKILEDKIDKL